jgi:hypothetical protein
MHTPLSPAERRTLAAVAGMMVPPSAEYAVPGADDPAILDDICATLGRDTVPLRAALASLGNFADLDAPAREAAAERFRATGGTALDTLTRVILQCYYRDDRVVRSLGREPRPPFPKGNLLEQGDWSLLDPVRARRPFWRGATG